MRSVLFQPPPFSSLGLVWSSPTPGGHVVPVQATELVPFSEWALQQLREAIGDRTIIVIRTGETAHDSHLEAANGVHGFASAAVQAVHREPAAIGGWASSTRRGSARYLPFEITGTGAAFLWIGRVALGEDRHTTGFHVRYADRHPETQDLVHRDLDVTLVQWCKATGHEPEYPEAGAA